MRNTYKISVGKLQGRILMRDLDVAGRILR
jgi:hypothetical protein